MSDLIARLARATGGEFHEDYSAQDYLHLCHEAMGQLQTANAPTLEQMAQAFEAWENGFRAEPSKYLTAEECAAANVSVLSADRAAYFRELLAVALG